MRNESTDDYDYEYDYEHEIDMELSERLVTPASTIFISFSYS